MINLYYKDILLGELAFDNKTYTYTSNKKNEQLAKEKYFNMHEYTMYGSEGLQSSELPMFFKNLLKDYSRKDIIKIANIKEFDSDFEKLQKIALLDKDKSLFYIES